MSKAQDFNDMIDNIGEDAVYDPASIAFEIRDYVDSLLESMDLGFLKSDVVMDYDGQITVTIMDEMDEDDEQGAISFTFIEDDQDHTCAVVVTEDNKSSTLVDTEESLWWTTLRATGGKPKHADITRLITGELLEAILTEGIFHTAEGNIEEKFAWVVRAGKKIKKKIRLVPKRMTGKQKSALRKARRRAGTASAKRARKISSRVRKRLGLR